MGEHVPCWPFGRVEFMENLDEPTSTKRFFNRTLKDLGWDGTHNPFSMENTEIL